MRDWAVLTQDRKIRYRVPERKAWIDSGLKVFVVSSGNLDAMATAAVLLKAREGVESACCVNSGPFLFSVRKDSTFYRLK